MNATESITKTMSSHIQTSSEPPKKFRQPLKALSSQRNAPVKVKLVVKRRMAVAMSVAATLIAILCDGFSIKSYAENVQSEQSNHWVITGYIKKEGGDAL